MQYNRANDRRFTLRLERDLREALTAEARRQMRCLNSEIVIRLKQSLRRRRRSATADAGAEAERHT